MDSGREGDGEQPVKIGPGYPQFQLAKAFAAVSNSQDAEAGQRASARVMSWLHVLKGLFSGSLEHGSRTPVKDIPAWATLDVVTGGFATGALLAAGPLHEHELALQRAIGAERWGDDRTALNTYYLTDSGLSQLQDLLVSKKYIVNIPEEGGLLAAAWLVNAGHADRAKALVEQLSPFFSRLRFYPVPGGQAALSQSMVYLQDAKLTARQLRCARPHVGVLAQKEAVEIWAPFLDRMVALVLETARDDLPFQAYPDTWAARARALLDDFATLRKVHHLCRAPENPRKHFAQLLRALEQAAKAPQVLTGRDVARAQRILKGYTSKRGAPDSEQLASYRQSQRSAVAAPLHHQLAVLVSERAEAHEGGLSAAELALASEPVTGEESFRHGVPVGTPIPASILRKLRRSLADSVEELARQQIIPSGEVLGQVLPQIVSNIRAQSIEDAQLRALYGSVYRAFRRRRSLLLLNLEKQVQIEELPWVAAMERFRARQDDAQQVSRQALVQVAATALSAFPQALLPNRLLRELRALAKGAELDMPIVEELAADIFMGEFSGKFVEATLLSAAVLKDSLYATYFAIDYEKLARELGDPQAGRTQTRSAESALFAASCRARAGVATGSSPAVNGMVIEQQQILTTHNLAALFSLPEVRSLLQPSLFTMAQECFRWVCRRQQMRVEDFHGRLIMLKNTAYAWRQMIFFLSLQPERISGFLDWAREHYQRQPQKFRDRFQPAMAGLERASTGQVPSDGSVAGRNDHRFLGWSNERHWLMPSEYARS